MACPVCGEGTRDGRFPPRDSGDIPRRGARLMGGDLSFLSLASRAPVRTWKLSRRREGARCKAVGSVLGGPVAKGKLWARSGKIHTLGGVVAGSRNQVGSAGFGRRRRATWQGVRQDQMGQRTREGKGLGCGTGGAMLELELELEPELLGGRRKRVGRRWEDHRLGATGSRPVSDAGDRME